MNGAAIATAGDGQSQRAAACGASNASAALIFMAYALQ
jgi:hypothetical protein